MSQYAETAVAEKMRRRHAPAAREAFVIGPSPTFGSHCFTSLALDFDVPNEQLICPGDEYLPFFIIRSATNGKASANAIRVSICATPVQLAGI